MGNLLNTVSVFLISSVMLNFQNDSLHAMKSALEHQDEASRSSHQIPFISLLEQQLTWTKDFVSQSSSLADSLYKEGLKDFFGSKKLEALSKFQLAAEHGHTHSMRMIGNVHRDNKKPQEAARWYTLSFQTVWLQTGTRDDQALTALKILNLEEASQFDNFLNHLYPISVLPSTTDFERLYQAYLGTPYESYLSPYERSLKKAKFLCLINNAMAKDQLGCLYVSGEIGKNLSEEERMQKACAFFKESGTPTALYNLGLLYHGGKIKENNPGEDQMKIAQGFFEKSGTLEALCCLGSMYYHGDIGKDMKEEGRTQKTLACFRKSGTPRAKYGIGCLYRDGKTGKPSERAEKAYGSFKECGMPEAQYEIGILYASGKIGQKLSHEQRMQKACQYLKESGTQKAQFQLGALLYYGEVEKDLPKQERIKKAKVFLESARTPEAYCTLGEMYQNNEVGENLIPQERIQLAYKYFSASNTPDAQCQLGIMLYAGEIEKDLPEQDRMRKAKEFLEKAGTPEAKYHLSCLYYDKKIGENLTPQERMDRVQSLLEASKVPAAYYSLGVMYRENIIGGTLSKEQRKQKIDILFKKSGLPEAQFCLGCMYCDAAIELNLTSKKGIQKLYQALGFFEKAVARGCHDAEEYMNLVRELLDDGEKISTHRKNMEPLEIIKNFEELIKTPLSIINSYDNTPLDELRDIATVQRMNSFLHSMQLYSNKSQSAQTEEDQSRESSLAQAHEEKPSASTSSDFDEKSEAKESVGGTTPDTQADEGEHLQASSSQHHEERSASLAASSHVDGKNGAQLTAKLPKEINREKTVKRLKDKLHSAFTDAKRLFLKGSSLLPREEKIKLVFANNKAKAEFKKKFCQQKKLQEVIKDIFENPRGLEGVGRPEFLKANLKGYCSRQLNAKDRLVYRVESGKIIIRSWTGHYD